MRKFTASTLVLYLLASRCFAQEVPHNQEPSLVSPPAISVHFVLNDFTTPERLRAASLSSVLRHHQWASISEMYPGMGITYSKGLLKHMDMASSLTASFVRLTVNEAAGVTDNRLLLEGTATVTIKLLTDRYMVDPYLIAGIGVSKYRSYYGAFTPLGGGIKINFFNEAALMVSTQYCIPVTTQTSNYHFVHSIGIAGVLKAKKLQ